MSFLDNIDYEDYPNVEFTQLDDKPFIIMDSWETVEKWNEKFPNWETDIDYEWGFHDEYCTCSECYSAIRTSPDSYGWEPDFHLTDGAIYCKDCVDSDEYIEDHINRNKLLNTDLADPCDYDYDMLEDLRFENGLHYGQKSDPSAIIKLLNAHKIDCLFTGYTGQFDVTFYTWVKSENMELAQHILENGNTDLPYDPGREMAKVLRGEHSDHINRVESVVSQQDFIDGNIPEVDGNTVHSITVK